MGYASCALCSGDVTRGDMLLRRALRFEGSVYGACCRAQIDDLVPADTKRRKPGLFVLLGLAGAVSIAAFARPGRASAPSVETPSEPVTAPAENTPPRPAEQLAAEQAEAKARVVADKLASALGEDLAALLATSDAQATLGAPPLRVTRESIALLAQVPSGLGS